MGLGRFIHSGDLLSSHRTVLQARIVGGMETKIHPAAHSHFHACSPSCRGSGYAGWRCQFRCVPLCGTTRPARLSSRPSGGITRFMKIIPRLFAVIAATVLAGCSTTPPNGDSTGLPSTPLNAVPLAPPLSREAIQVARSFLESVRAEDWNAVAEFWPQNTQQHFDDVFTEQTKNLTGGLKIINLGKPYSEGLHTWIFVPYQVRFKNGQIRANTLRIQKQRDGHWIFEGGF